MTSDRLELIVTSVAAATGCAAAASALAAVAVPHDLAWLLWVAAGIGLLGAGTAVALLVRRWSWERSVGQRYLDTLTRLQRGELTVDCVRDELPQLPAGHPLRFTLDELQTATIERTQQLSLLEHRQAALEIRSRRSAAAQERISSILNSLPDPLLVIDGYDELILANPRAEQLFGIAAAGDHERRLASQVIHCQPLLDLMNDVRRHRSAGSRSEDIEIEIDPETRCWFRVTVNALGGPLEANNDERGAVAVLRDITAERSAQTRHAEFVSAVSHEMKTPLASIKAYVELLADREAEDEETREEFLGVINSQADRLQRLIDNLLNLARIEAGVAKVNKRNRPLNELLDEAVNVMHPAAQRKNVELVADLSQMFLGVFGDRDMLMQAAINLLSNAIKYTHEGGRVTLRSRLVDKEIQFEVEDTGVGLSAEDCQRVFEKFYRVRKDADMAPGTGLGLALVKHIIEDVHGGHISVGSQLGVGSTFRVTIPCSGQVDAPRESNLLMAGAR
jgi:two-component system phosphate regulon sensor histidine kinase PhoR